MTYREYLETCDDEFEKTVILANLARKHPHYDTYSPKRKKETLKELLDAEMPQSIQEEKAEECERDG